MVETDYLTDQARQCRAAALRAQSRPERMGLMQLARHYEAEAGRIAAAERRSGGRAGAPAQLGGSSPA